MTTLRAAIYCRISDDRESEGHGVERQRQDCLARAQREGWTVVETYTDNDIGASALSRKPRPAYRAMLDAAERGELDVICAYSNSRLTRRPMELEDLITLHRDTGVLLRTIVSGDDDLSTADGQMVARIKGAVDAAEAGRISERTKRGLKQRRDNGQRIGGRAPYGYVNEEGKTGRLTIHAERAAVVREVAARLLAGETVYGVLSDLNGRGIRTGPSQRTPDGATWTPRTLKRVVMNPAVTGALALPDGTLTDVADPIISRADWERLCEILYQPSRRSPDWTNRRKYVLSGLMRCGLCGHVLSGSTRSAYGTGEKIQTFQCATGNGGCGKLRIDYAPVEEWVLSLVFARLDVPAVADALTTDTDTGEADALRVAIGDAERGLTRVDDAFADGLLDKTRYAAQVARFTSEIDGARTRLAALATDAVPAVDAANLRAEWPGYDLPRQRQIIGAVLASVTIEPHPGGAGTRLPRRSGDTDSALAERRRAHLDSLLSRRVSPVWLV